MINMIVNTTEQTHLIIRKDEKFAIKSWVSGIKWVQKKITIFHQFIL